MLLSGQFNWHVQAEMLLHFAARAEHVAETIRPTLAAGTVVVCDRFYDSTMAYQGYGQGADRAQIAALIAMVGIAPDVTLMLDGSEPVAAARTAARGRASDRYDRLGPGFHARVAAGFRAIAAAEPQRCHLVDANAEADAVFIRLTQTLRSLSLWEGVRVRGTPAAPAVEPSPSPDPLPEEQSFMATGRVKPAP